MSAGCCIEYRVDSFKSQAFETYAKHWLGIIPRCGGDLIGHFLPHDGTNDIAIALIAFDSLAAYKAYHARLKTDDAGSANFQYANQEKFILEERRTFLRKVAH